MRELVLLRGLPGSGKSTLAQVLSDGKYPVLGVDDFFTDPTTKNYNFEFDKNHLAYKQCEENTRAAMQNNTAKIFVANTFTMSWEIEPYLKLAAKFDYRLHVITVEKYHSGTNVHEVTAEQLQKMADKYHVKLI